MKFDHPKGLLLFLFLEACERFSFYGANSIFALFMVAVLLFTAPFASQFFGIYGGLIYLTPLLGGYLSDKYLGNRKSILLGGLLMILGQFLFAFCASFFELAPVSAHHGYLIFDYKEILFLCGICLSVIGSGFFQPSITSSVRLLYKANDDEKIDAAYSIFYTAINVGAFLSPIIMGYLVLLGGPSNYKWIFLINGLVLTVGIIVFYLLKNKYFVNDSNVPIGITPYQKENSLLSDNELDEFLYKKYEDDADKYKNLSADKKRDILRNEPLTKVEKERMYVIFLFSFIYVFFGIAFNQCAISLTFFTARFIDKTVPFTNIVLTSPVFQAFNPLFIIILGPIIFFFFSWLTERGHRLSLVSKIIISFVIMAFGYFLLCIPGYFVDCGVHNLSMVPIIVLYFLMAISELFISPVGLSEIFKLVPFKLMSIVIGIWYLARAGSFFLAGYFSSLYPSPLSSSIPYLFGIIPINGFVEFFGMFVVLCLFAALIAFIFRKKIHKWMHGVH